MTREERVRELFARISAGDAGAAELYHDTGTIRNRAECPVVDREAIRGFYESVVARMSPQVEIVDLISNERRVVAVLRAPTSGGVCRRAVDVFEVDADASHSPEIYSDGQPLPPA